MNTLFAGLDAVTLARMQFAFTVAFHFIFPSFTIGLASFLAVLEGLWLYTGRSHYLRLFKYWIKIFAITFAMGVVSGIVMSYQFGTNWSRFSDLTGPVLGPLMAYEVLTAFFLEAGFLGIMLFGLDRVGKRLHFTATLLVAFGTCLSATWILSVNSWMHTPQGFAVDSATGQFLPMSWWSIVFNPSFPFRLAHTLTGAFLTTALVVGAVGAWQLLRGHRSNPAVRTQFSMAMGMIAVVAPLQILLGDLHGINTLEHQPQKVMAMEGHFDSHPDGAPLILAGIVNAEQKRIDYAISIPKLSSLILKHDLNAPLAGLDTIPDAQEPPVAIVFYSFRIMVGLGMLMALLGVLALLARWRGTLYSNRWLHRFSLAMGPAGFVAVIAGWTTTEVGRQPWVVYGHLLTVDAASPLAAEAVSASLTAFIVIYFTVFGAGVFYILRLMGRPPQVDEAPTATGEPIRTAGIAPGVAMGDAALES